ncbi:MAG: hypothetical protein JJT95_07375 [Pararhodobacter sp.]|nr:hypothetical protein [Pararhodobacter sp.]
MQVIVHIGSPKAGSTTLQHALRVNREALAGQGIMFWEPDPRHGPPARILANRFARPGKPLLPRERLYFASREEATARSLEFWAELAEKVRLERPAVTILSSESLFAVKPPRQVLDALGETFDKITILAYMRDPVALYGSALDQIIRDGARLAKLWLPVEFGFPSARVLAQYADRLGDEHVVVRHLVRDNLVGGDLLADFLGSLGTILGRQVTLIKHPAASNESLCAAATVWLLGLNETFSRFGGSGDQRMIRDRAALIDQLRRAPELAGLPKLSIAGTELADWVRATQRDDIALLNERFLAAQRPIDLPPDDVALPDAGRMRALMREWLLSQAPGEALERVMQAALALPGGEEKAQGQAQP